MKTNCFLSIPHAVRIPVARLGLALAALLLTTAEAAVIPTTTDLWDLSQGASVTATSGVRSGFSAGDIFGTAASTAEPGNTVFAESQPAGFVHYVEWRTASPIIVNSFALFAAGDGAANGNAREFDRFVLKAKTPGSATYDLVLYDYTATHPYSFVDAGAQLLLNVSITAVTAQEFRAEFVQSASVGFYKGPRVVELDAFGSVVSPPPTEPADFLPVSGQMVSPRLPQSATLLADGRVLLSGGGPLTSPVAVQMDIYDPVSNTLSLGGSMQVPRMAHTATLLSDGKVLIAGGLTTNNVTTALCELFDPATGQCTFTGSLVLPRRGHVSFRLPDGRVVLLDGGGPAPAREVQVYNPATGTFALAGLLNVTRSSFSATLLQDGRVLVAGGLVSGVAQATAEIYDPATGISSYVGNMSSPRFGHAEARLTDGRVLVVGGRNSAGSPNAIATAEIFNPATGTFASAGSMTQPRIEHTATALLDGTVLVTGGINSSSPSVTYDTAEVYDPVSNQFTPVGDMSTPRTQHRATLLLNGQVLVSGGRNYQPLTYLRTAELYDPVLTFRASEIYALNNAVVSLTSQVNELQAENAALNTQLATANSTIGSLQEQVSGLITNNTSLSTQLAQAQADLANANAMITQLTANIATLQSQLIAANSVIENQQVQIELLLGNVATLTSQLQQSQVELAAAQAANQELTTQVNTLTAANQQLQGQLDASSQQVSNLTQLLAAGFEDPEFQIPGVTLQEQLLNLVQAISEMNHGQQQALYLNLK